MIITIDGPIATGKSTVAKNLAEKLGFLYFDTGAMYRCLTHGILKQNLNLESSEELLAFLAGFTFEIKKYHKETRYFIAEEDVTDAIRQDAVTAAVSRVAAIKAVREKLVALQRELSVGVNAVFEGRDMGTVVFPKADIKVFLTGRTEVRAQRRHQELRSRFPKETKDLTIEQTILDINARDAYDSTRAISPLRQADDAYVVDTSDLTVDEIVFKILEYKDSLLTKRRNNHNGK